MESANNDNFDPWQSIGLQTALIVNKLRCQAQLVVSEEEQEDRERKAARERAEKQKAETESAYIAHRLREIAEWERRISGNKKLRR